MRKIFRLLLVLSIVLFTSCGKKVTEYEALQMLNNHLIKRYGEEFEIGYMGKRSRGEKIWYQAEIYPAKYKGTPKENDEYYKSHGNVNIEKDIFGEKIGYVGDLYRVVLFNESANEFYLPKLKELFGENVLPVLEIDSSRVSKNPEFLSNPKFLPEYKKRLEDGSLPFLKGGIYIFGRVENDEDREWYRKQIYEFVQFMKQTGTFEYVDLGIIIWDERVLSEEFRTNDELRREILVARNTIKDDKEFVKERKRLMKQTDESLKKLTKEEKEQVLNNYIKSDIYGIGNNSKTIFAQNKLLSLRLYSPKYIEMKGWNKSKNPDVYEEIKNYDNVSDVKFTFEQY